MKKIYTSLLMLICATAIGQTLSPKITATAGGRAIGGGVSLSYTIGETFNTKLSANTIQLTQGQQQPEIDLRLGTTQAASCAGSSLSFPFTAAGYVDAANVFTVELSDANGSFANPVVIGSLTSMVSDSIAATMPAVANGSGYKARVVSSNPSRISSDLVSVTVNTTAAPTASAQTICFSGTVADLVATGTGIQWYDVAANGTALATSSALTSGTYYVSQTLNSCESTRTAVSITVSDTQALEITCPANILVSNDANQCSAVVTFAATATGNCGTATITYSHASGSTFSLGTTTVTATADDGNGNTASCTFDVTVEVPTTTVAKVSALSVRYQDNVTLYAEVESNCGIGALTGSVEFFLDGVSVGSAAAYPIPFGEPGYPTKLMATLIHKVTEIPKVPSTTPWVVKAKFTPSTANYLRSEGTTDLIINPREASSLGTGYYTGDVFVWAPSGTSTGTVLLAATIKDLNLPLGDVRGAKATFYFVNNGVYTAIPGAKNLPVGLLNILDGTVGSASATIQLNIGNQNSANWTIAVGISGGYINRKSDPTALASITVAKALPGGYIVGGGTVLNTSAASGLIKGAVGQTTSFSMDVKYNNKGTNAQGKINNIMIKSYYKPDGTLDNNILHTYMVSSTAISGLTVNQPAVNNASFTSKATLIEMFDGYTTSIEGNANLQIATTDNGKNGVGDNIAITLYRKAGGIWFSSNWNVTKTSEQLILAGNIYVSGSSGGKIAAEEAIVEEVQFKVAAFPNPTEGKFTLRVDGNNKDEVEIKVMNMTGILLYSNKGTANTTYTFGEHFTSGAYFVEVQQGINKATLKLIKK